MRPRLIGFLCEWCAAKALENMAHKRLRLPDGFMPLRVNCSGAVELSLITQALYEGASGVLVGGCPKGQCHYREGNTRAAIRLRAYRRLLEALGLPPDRIRAVWVGSGEGERLYQAIWQFWKELTGEASPL